MADVERAVARPHLEGVYGTFEVDAQRDALVAKTDPTTHRIVLREGRPVGCQWVRGHDDTLELERLYLLPASQGRGIRTALVERLGADARAQGRDVRLRVLRGSPARALYTRLGSAVTGRTETHEHLRWAAR